LREELWSGDERVEAVFPNGMRVVKSPAPSARDVSVLMQGLEAAVEKFNHAELFNAIEDIVSGYKLAGANKTAQSAVGVK
jgi:hypothetical protein